MSNENSRLYRGPKNSVVSTSAEPCHKNSSDCMFLSSAGTCSAEWCIFEELPTVVSGSRTLTCSICGKNTKTVSVYSGTTSYVCPECQEKLRIITPDEKHCALCGAGISLDQYICPDCQEKLVHSIQEHNCPICGASIEIGQGICSSCAQKIREKLNE